MSPIYVVSTINEANGNFEDVEFATSQFTDKFNVWAVVEDGFMTRYFDTNAAAKLYIGGFDGLREVSRSEVEAIGIAHEVGTPSTLDFNVHVHIVNIYVEMEG